MRHNADDFSDNFKDSRLLKFWDTCIFKKDADEVKYLKKYIKTILISIKIFSTIKLILLFLWEISKWIFMLKQINTSM